jgi:hypothetical protein
MKKLLVLFMVLGVLSGSHAVAQKIKGSDTLLPLSQLVVERGGNDNSERVYVATRMFYSSSQPIQSTLTFLMRHYFLIV